MNGLSGLVTNDDVIVKYLKEGDPRRALHELHDGMDAYSNILLYHLTRLYEHDRRETMITCARMFPDVQPWEAMEICRQNNGLSLEARSDDFVFYVEQLMRWRAQVGNTKEQTVSSICEDVGVAMWWFHCSLVADSSREEMHCRHCRNPRPGSHMVPWQKSDHLQQLIDFLLHKDPKECKDFMDLCWKHGYWEGLIRLCVQKNLRKDALKLVFALNDLNLVMGTQPWGRLPKSLDEWRYLLELLLSRDGHSDKSCASPRSCIPLSLADWTPNLTWSNVINLMLERLGAGHTVNLLQALPRNTPLLTTDFYYSCLLGAVIERRQRTLIHELLKKLDSYLWSQRSGSLAPKLNSFRKDEETYGSNSKEDKNPQLDSVEQFRTLEDGASNWGQNIRLSDGECLVCSLKLCEQISTSNQGLLLFECGHIFHKHCVPEEACVVCFQQNLTTLGGKGL